MEKGDQVHKEQGAYPSSHSHGQVKTRPRVLKSPLDSHSMYFYHLKAAKEDYALLSILEDVGHLQGQLAL